MDDERKKVIATFLDEFESLCKKHDVSIGHEDCHGAFIIEKYDDWNIEWLRQAEEHAK